MGYPICDLQLQKLERATEEDALPSVFLKYKQSYEVMAYLLQRSPGVLSALGSLTSLDLVPEFVKATVRRCVPLWWHTVMIS